MNRCIGARLRASIALALFALLASSTAATAETLAEIWDKEHIDERITLPRNYVAADSGTWGPNTKLDFLKIDFNPAFHGNFYVSCGITNIEKWHPQHAVRLRNKDGRAYFAVSQSQENGGWISIIETYPDMIDANDRIKTNGGNGVGTYVWEDFYNDGRTNFAWNHPGKMELIGDLLVVTAQYFAGSVFCSWGDAQNQDALIYYDVRNPREPVYLGHVYAQNLGLIQGENVIDSLGIARDPGTGKYLSVFGCGSGSCKIGDVYDGRSVVMDYAWPPRPAQWTDIPGGLPFDLSFVGQHGMLFNSYQTTTVVTRGVQFPNGTERMMAFDKDSGVDPVGFKIGEALYRPQGNPFFQTAGREYSMPDYPLADRDFDSMSLYINRAGRPTAYGARSFEGNIGNLLQWSDPANDTLTRPAKDYPVTNCNDSGPGSLRDAIGYGGNGGIIELTPETLKCDTITLTTGPLVIYLHHVNINAAKMPKGLTISGGDKSPVFRITSGNIVTLNTLHITDGFDLGYTGAKFRPAEDDRGFGGGIRNEGDLLILNSTISSNKAIQGGGIYNEGRLEMRNSTVVGNESTVGTGAGIMNLGILSLINTTVVSNVAGTFNPGADWKGAGIVSFDNLPRPPKVFVPAELTITNSIIAGNRSKTNADLDGFYKTGGPNLVFASTGVLLSGPTPITGDPGLLPLGDYGGPTPTLRPRYTSPVIDAGSAVEFLDQRGFPRPLGGGHDLGAVESLVKYVSPLPGQTGVSVQPTLAWTATAEATYTVFFSLDGGATFLQMVSGLTTGSFTLPPLEANTLYAWRVDITYRGRTHAGDVSGFRTRTPLVVTTLLDENDAGMGLGAGDSLRELIAVAEPGGTITFAPALAGETIRLGGTELHIGKSLTIDASALTGGITVDARGQSRVFLADTGTVVLDNLTIKGGFSAFGGGILSGGAALTLRNCVLTANETPDFGGALYSWNGSNLTIVDTTISANKAAEGAGIWHNGGYGGSFALRQSTVSGNTATGKGGGLFLAGGAELIENATLAGNRSDTDGGGAIATVVGAALTLRHATVAANQGVGIVVAAGTSLSLDNSIVGNNTVAAGAASDIVGDYTAIGANLVRVHAGTRLGGPAPLTADPKLGPLAAGKPTQVMNPAPTSPILNAGAVTANTPAQDQKHVSRIRNLVPDLGAVETFLELSSDATLEWLELSAGSLAPAFQPATVAYTVKVANPVATLTLRPSSKEPDARVQVRVNNGAFTIVPWRQFSPVLPLNLGANVVDVVVTAPDGQIFTSYALTVVRSTEPALAQSIIFGAAPQVFVGKTGTVFATATSGLPVSLSSPTPSVCTVAGSTVTGVAAGNCNIIATQGGDDLFVPAAPASQGITVLLVSLASSRNPSPVGDEVVFTAGVPGPGTGKVDFKDGASTLAGCAAVAVTGGEAKCTTHALAIGAHGITATYSGDAANAASTSPFLTQVISALPNGAGKYQGLWWKSPAFSESGWGINFAHQGELIFATWFTYDANRKPLWLAAVLELVTPGVYTGEVFVTSGPPFTTVPFNSLPVVETLIGTATVTFSGDDNASFAYTVNLPAIAPAAVTQLKTIERQKFADPVPTCTFGTLGNLALATNYQDLWWAAGGSESGWGVNFTHQGDIIFFTWYTYGADGKPLWLIAVASKTAPGVYSGPISTVAGPPLGAQPWDQTTVVETEVGSTTITFTDGNHATFTYTVNGVTQTKNIERQVFVAPGTVCE